MQKSLFSTILLFGVGLLLATGFLVLLVPGRLDTLFSSGYFMPHRHCYLDTPRMLWLQGLSDFLIGAAYMAISAALTYLVYKAYKDLPFMPLFLAFGLFIFSCGWTHFMEVWTLWNPTYWLSGVIKGITALASLITAVGIFWLMPYMFTLINTAKAAEKHREDLEKAHLELSSANEKLAAANSELESFSYSLSHDMRAPLRAIAGYTELILEDHRPHIPGEVADLMEKIDRASLRMDQLITDVLALTYISRTEIHTEAIDVESLIRQIIEERPEMQPPRAQISIQSPLIPMLGDRASLTQCLTNLMSNAIKFVPQGVTPQVQIRTTSIPAPPISGPNRPTPPVQEQWVRIWVIDNGIGISPESQEKLFKMFQRLQQQGAYEGTGIGLVIVRKAVERMGGHVGVESRSGQGSKFWVELPKGAHLDTATTR